MALKYDKEEVKAAIPLSDLIGLTVGWDRAKTDAPRGDFWAQCPFHNEVTPSFHVLDQKGFYYCFGCSASGDHFNWCRQWYGDDFPDAVQRVAELAGLDPQTHFFGRDAVSLCNFSRAERGLCRGSHFRFLLLGDGCRCLVSL